MVAAFLGCALSPAAANDVLYHVDGNRIEGTVVSETPDSITIRTKFGPMTYQRSDLLRVVRPSLLPPKAVVPPAAEKIRLTTMRLPAGPIDPLRPPDLTYLFPLAAKPAPPAPTTGTVTATPALPKP